MMNFTYHLPYPHVNFLIHNQSYSTCGGIKLGFKKDNNQIVGRDTYTELKNFL